MKLASNETHNVYETHNTMLFLSQKAAISFLRGDRRRETIIFVFLFLIVLTSFIILATISDFTQINNQTEEKVVCNDGVKDFLQDAGIADDCRFYTWTGSMDGYTPVEYRSLACHKLDGGYEIIPNYSGIN